MRVLIVAPGSTGDVVPFTGLGARLMADGHHVAIAANERFRATVTAAGPEFRLLRGDPEEGNTSDEGRRWHAAGTGPLGQIRMTRVLLDYVDQVSQDFEAVMRQGADVVLLNAVALFTGWHVAEGLAVPSAGVFPGPAHPSGEVPPALLGLPDLTPRLNRALTRAALTAGAASSARTVRPLRERLGLPRMRASSLWGELERRGWPVFYGFSEALLPRPTDWPRSAVVTGTWWPAVPPDPAPDPELEAFLDDGPPPVFVGLGSRALVDPDRVRTAVRDGLRRAGLRGVVQAGWGGLSLDGDDVLTIGEAPHATLFPRMAAVAHHCGAGTTQAGLRAGVPTVGLPVLADQPYWASRLVTIGASPASVPLRTITADRFAAALTAATTDDRYRRRAEELSRVVRAEDGAGVVADLLPRMSSA